MASKMDGIIDKVADAGEKIADKFDHSEDKAENGEAATGSHRGEVAEEHKPGIMDKIADATEKLVEKFDHSDSTPPPSVTPALPPAEIPGPALGGGTSQHMDPTGKIV